MLLIKGGDLLVDGSVAVAHRLKVSPLLIGLVLVGFGTSSPELATSLLAAYRRAEGIAVGNVIGSNVANILLVLGVAAFIQRVPVRRASFRRDSFFLILSTVILVLALLWGRIGFILGLLMCVALGWYVYYSYQTEKVSQFTMEEVEQTVSKNPGRGAFGKDVLRAVSGIMLTLFGAHLLVENGVLLASSWGVSETVIGLTMIAVGTSLPELATSVIASLKKQSDLALGNVIGSNIYNALFILGFTALFVPIQVPAHILVDIVVMALATGLLLFFGFQNKLSKKCGILFVVLYALYIVYLVHSA